MNSILERVNAACNQVRLLNPGPVTFRKLVSTTRKQFNVFNLDVIITLSKEKKKLGDDEFYIMAYYDSEGDYDNETPIEIIIHHNINSDKPFPPHAATDFLIQVYDAVVHEYKHQMQSYCRKHETYWEHPGTEDYRVYLADPDEVDAYAFSIAIEVLRFMPRDRAIRYLSRMHALGKMRKGLALVTPNLQSYLMHFKGSRLLRRLAKKIYYHLVTIDTRHIFM